MPPPLHIHHEGPSDLYEHRRFLGEGNSTVDEVTHRGSKLDRTYARKRFVLPASASQAAARAVQNEIAVMSNLRHEHIVRLVSTYLWEQEDLFYLIMLPVADLDLKSLLRRTDRLRGSSEERRDNCRHMRRWPNCLFNALGYMHSKGIRHKDIKPGNILIKNGDVVLTDFGIAKDMARMGTTGTVGRASATWLYAAPEVVAEQRRGRSADVYSLGCVMLEICAVCSGDEDAIPFLYEQLWGTGVGSESYCDYPAQMLEWILTILHSPPRDPEMKPFIFKILQLTFLMLEPLPQTRISATGLIDVVWHPEHDDFSLLREWTCSHCRETVDSQFDRPLHAVFKKSRGKTIIPPDLTQCTDYAKLWKITKAAWLEEDIWWECNEHAATTQGPIQGRTLL